MVVHCVYYTYRPFRHGRQQDQKHISSRQHCRNPRPPRGGRLKPPVLLHVLFLFLSTPSARRATIRAIKARLLILNFYPRPPRGGRQFVDLGIEVILGFLSTPSARRATYPTFPHTCRTIRFLSTPSARRATVAVSVLYLLRQDFYPRPPRGGRLPMTLICPPLGYFYPRPPRGGRPVSASAADSQTDHISIHALREEGDSSLTLALKSSLDFYPRPPRGGRRILPSPILAEL